MAQGQQSACNFLNGLWLYRNAGIRQAITQKGLKARIAFNLGQEQGVSHLDDGNSLM